MLSITERFLCIYWDSQVIFILQFVDVLHYIYWPIYAALSLHTRDKSQLVWVNDLSDVSLDFIG